MRDGRRVRRAMVLLGLVSACAAPPARPPPTPTATVEDEATPRAEPEPPAEPESAEPEPEPEPESPEPESPEPEPERPDDCGPIELSPRMSGPLPAWKGTSRERIRACLGPPDEDQTEQGALWIYRRPDRCSDRRTTVEIRFRKGRVATASAQTRQTGEYCVPHDM